MTLQDTQAQERRGGGPENADGNAPAPTENSLEIELKLAGPSDVLESLWGSTIAPRTKTVGRRLISTYYDTSDFRLRRRGFTLRVRQDENDFVQTVKAENGVAQSVMQRGEWSTPTDGPAPDLTKLGDAELLDKIGLIVAGELQPIFTTDVTRQTKRYRVNRRGVGRAHVEAALDTGEIRCEGKREAISEIELELLTGSVVALQKEAARIHHASPLQFQPLSKAERGFALALGGHPTGQKSKLPNLAPDTSVERGLGSVLNNCMGHWLANHAAVLDGRDTEGVHQMRVALRRMRSALTIFKSILPVEDYEWLQSEAKSLIGDLGGVRDWDVFVDELLQPVIEARPEDANLIVLRDAVDQERRLAQERARSALRSPAYLRFVLELGAWLESRGWRRAETQTSLDRRLVVLADEVLRKRHKQAVKLGRNFDTLPDEALHRLRISLKKLRYATEFFVSLYGKGRTETYLFALRQLQDDLGHLNDVAVAETRLRDVCGRHADSNAGALQAAFGTVIGWHSHTLAQVRPRIAKDWLEFTRTKTFWEQKDVRV